MVKLGVWKDDLSSGLMIELRGMSPSLTPEVSTIISGQGDEAAAGTRRMEGE